MIYNLRGCIKTTHTKAMLCIYIANEDLHTLYHYYLFTDICDPPNKNQHLVVF